MANKTGDLVGIQHDVGIFELPDGRRYLIAMFTGDLENDSAGIAAISQVSPGGVSGPSGLTAALCALMRSAALSGGAPVLCRPEAKWALRLHPAMI